MPPALSVLLPAYNGGRYLTAQIESILNQTTEDIELVAIDDGSTDDTQSRLDAFARRDRRVRVLPSSGNRGQKRRLKELADAAGAELFCVADQDDIWEPRKLERLVEAIGNRALAFGSSWIIDGEGRAAGRTILDILPPQPSSGDRLIYLFKPMVSAHGMIIRRPVFDSVALMRAHPFDWLQSLDAVFGQGLIYVPEAVTWHRLHDTNQSNGPLGQLPGFWQNLTPKENRRRQNLRLTERWMTVQRLEHLANSPFIGEPMNAIFAKAHRLCAAAWFETDRPLSLNDPALAHELAELLLPLAGSQRDREFSSYYLRRLARSAWHPLDAAKHLAVSLRGARKAMATAVQDDVTGPPISGSADRGS